MSLTLFTTALALLIPPLMLASVALLMYPSDPDNEKLSPYECGFDSKDSARRPFSLRFFLIAVIFLIFDIEIIILLPIPYLACVSSQSPPAGLGIIMFLIILALGLSHEWDEGSLEWVE